MKLIIAALVFLLILTCVTSKDDYTIVDNMPQVHKDLKPGELPDSVSIAAEGVR